MLKHNGLIKGRRNSVRIAFYIQKRVRNIMTTHVVTVGILVNGEHFKFDVGTITSPPRFAECVVTIPILEERDEVIDAIVDQAIEDLQRSNPWLLTEGL